MSDSGIEGKIALVTAGTSGIGEASARLLARHGAKVLIVGRNAEKANQIVSEIGASGGEAAFYAADLADPEKAVSCVEAAVSRFGGLDIAFNNVGGRESSAPLGDQTLDEFDAVMNLNLRSIFLSMKAQIAAMTQRGGVIVNNASVSGVRNNQPGLSVYAASKAALISLTRTAAMEYAARGIRINTFSPGKVMTGMMRSYKAMDPQAIADSLPARRLGTEEEAAQVVLFMVSPASSWMFGHNLCADGGYLAS